MSGFTVRLDERLWREMAEDLTRGKPELVRNAIRRAVGFGASTFRGMLKTATQTNELGWKPISDVSLVIPENPPETKAEREHYGKRGGRMRNRHRSAAARRGGAVKKRQPGFLGKLRNVFRFDLSEPSAAVPSAFVGILEKFVSRKAVERFAAFQQGGPVKPTWARPGLDINSMARYFGALGFRLKKGTKPERPARDLVGPLWVKKNDAIQRAMLIKFAERLRKPK